ncbi:hypothetical protein BUALT_Bualt03G0110500 [Buddleja alternifolia]|uniref:Tubulin/FtsZ GTPase domain-containing protein n=1 Tax=Buddleja alternifolia TaxID=168488 RepID=A0AAV6XV27_9LAMI|nr:hypothetical protein BUALT_Bualt03G0110500 [Buddleja alternifolia]
MFTTMTMKSSRYILLRRAIDSKTVIPFLSGGFLAILLVRIRLPTHSPVLNGFDSPRNHEDLVYVPVIKRYSLIERDKEMMKQRRNFEILLASSSISADNENAILIVSFIYALAWYLASTLLAAAVWGLMDYKPVSFLDPWLSNVFMETKVKGHLMSICFEMSIWLGNYINPLSVNGTWKALEAIEKLQKNVDTLIVVPNDRLLDIAGEHTPLHDAFFVADDVLRQDVQGISDIITVSALISYEPLVLHLQILFIYSKVSPLPQSNESWFKVFYLHIQI